ncbi:hypothetical protein [Nostoc sp.]|uniref:hypothetical protein n=1 Tax=Nostoc sp. TaxID=1180 RepID=UPI002FFA7E4C
MSEVSIDSANKDKLESYKKQIAKTVFSGSKQQQKITEILKQMEDDKELTDDDKLLIESQITQINIPIAKVEDGNSERKSNDNKRHFPRYDFKQDFKELDGLKEFNFNEKISDLYIAKEYASWFKAEYLPKFLPMPGSELQYPIATVFALLNCKCVLSPRQCIPMPYCIGSNGSGKTEFGKTVAQHYPRQLYVEIRPGNTGAGARDALDEKFGRGDAGFCLIDNFNTNDALQKWGAHYDILLANNEESAISRISGGSDGNKSEFRHYSYKMFTSIFDLSKGDAGEFGEIERRTIALNFREGSPENNRIMYSWEGMERVFQRMWGDESMELLHKVYAPALAKLGNLKPVAIPSSIPAKKWVICQVPIAVGVYCGVWKTQEEGIQAFADHFEYLKGSKNNGVGSALSIVLTKLIKEELPKQGESNRANRYASAVSKRIDMEISQDELVKQVTTRLGFPIGRRDMDGVITLMSNFGYNYEQVGQAMGFVKQATLKKE